MTDANSKVSRQRDARQARLEQALRENLKKRKDLARKRSSSGPSEVEGPRQTPPEETSED